MLIQSIWFRLNPRQSFNHSFQNGGIIPSLKMETNAALGMELGPDLEKIIGSEIISVIQSEKGEGVVAVTIKSEGNQDGIRGTETQQGFIQGIFQNEQPFFSFNSFRQRTIDQDSLAFSATGFFGKTAAGIKLQGIGMKADQASCWVLQDKGLSSIAMMEIDVDM